MPRFQTVNTRDVTLNVALDGDPSMPAVVCLHGFPEYWGAWREVMELLARDHYVIAPDQRGYNLSSRPADVEAYRVRHLVADLASVVDQLLPERRFVLAGHDWGASVAYAYAFAHPRRLTHLVIANGVHPVCFQRAIFEDEAQRKASQYINRLKAPDAEQLLSANGHAKLMRMIDGFSSAASFMTPAVRASYLEAWSREGALTAMLNWYRASPIEVPAAGAPTTRSIVLDLPAESFRVSMPHLLIWGEQDQALRPASHAGLAEFAADLTVERIPDAGHWVLHEKPDTVAEAIRRFVSG